MKQQKIKYNRRRYKMQIGAQQVYGYTPEEADYSEANALQAEQDQKIGVVNQGLNSLAGKYAAVGQIGSVAGSLIKNKAKNKEAGAAWAGGVETGLSGAAAGANIGQQFGGAKGALIGAGVGLVGGAIGGAIHGKKTYKKVKSEAQKEESRIAGINAQKERDAAFRSAYGNYTQEQPITAQAALAKRGKYKVKSKQPRMIETEGREPIFSPKKPDGTRDLLYYNPNDPTHEEGGVKAVVMPKNRYNNGTNNLMPKRSKISLLGSGNMAVGAKQVKVNDLNDTSLSQNLGGIPAVNAANKFTQPMAGKMQVARQIPEYRRKEKQNTPRSHRKENPDTNRIIDPPMLYEMKPPPPRSTFNTKNDYKKGGSYIRTYQDGTEATATYKHTKTFKSKPVYQTALQAHDDSLNLYGQSRYFTNKVKESGLYNSTLENPPVKNITRTGTGKTSSPTKPFGFPDDTTEDVMSVAGINPIRKDLYSRKESKYKSFKEYDEVKASGKEHDKHEGYEINMYKHPEMALRYEADTTQPLQIKKPNFNITKDKTTVRRPSMINNTSDTTSKQNKETIALNKSKGKFVGREKTFFEKAEEFLDKVGPSNRMSNGKKIKVYK